MINIQIDNAIPPSVDVATLENAARVTLKLANAPLEADLTIVLTGDEQLHRLNYQFLGIDASTDVLSFPDGDRDPDTGIRYLGDILISVPRAQTQAAAEGHPDRDELLVLIVHGVLHLLGYNHTEDVEKEQMWSAQSEILHILGSSITSPT